MAKRGALERIAETVTARKKAAKAARPKQVRAEPLQSTPVDPHTAQHGEYETHNGRTFNRGGTAVARWVNAGMLSQSQQAAILHCQRLWRLAFRLPNVVANLDRTCHGETRDDPRSIDARIDLKRIQGHFPRQYWDIFENVCRHGEPAGLIGSYLVSDTRSASTHARLVVCMVADMIAMRERLSY